MPSPDPDPPRVRRVRPTTDGWLGRLAVAAVGSIALHAAPLGALFALRPRAPSIDLTVRTVEIGLESPHPGTRTPPSTPTPTLRPQPPAAPPPHAAAHPAVPTHAAHDETVARPSRAPAPAPSTTPVRAPPPALEPAASFPAVTQAASDLVPLVPRGAVVTLLLRSDHVRHSPDAPALRRLLRAIPDWNAMLGGADLDPLRDVDTLLLAAAQPFGTATQAPDWFVIARGRDGSDVRLRHAIEQMARPRAPSPIEPPAMDAGLDDESTMDPADAGALSRVWQHGPGGLPSITLQRYGARRTFTLLGDGMAAIALPGQVERLAAAMAARPPGLPGSDDPSLVLVVEADGVRNLATVGTSRGNFPLPRRFTMSLQQSLDATQRPDGAATLDARLQYDSPTDVATALQMFDYARSRWHVMIATRLGARGGLGRLLAGAVAGMAGIDVDALEAALDALSFRASGDRVEVHGAFTPVQVRAMLNAASLGADNGTQ